MARTTASAGRVDRVVGVENLPDPALRLSSLGCVDYGDWFSLATDVLAITSRSTTSIRLEAESWFVAGNLVVHASEGRVSLGTFLRYDRALARAVWTPLAAVHRRVAPGLLRDAEAAILRTDDH